MKSRVVRHGTRFLLRIFWERLRGIRPPAALAEASGARSVARRPTTDAQGTALLAPEPAAQGSGER